MTSSGTGDSSARRRGRQVNARALSGWQSWTQPGPSKPLCAMNDFERENTLYRVSIAVEEALDIAKRRHH
jgi:hypothetical protein